MYTGLPKNLLLVALSSFWVGWGKATFEKPCERAEVDGKFVSALYPIVKMALTGQKLAMRYVHTHGFITLLMNAIRL